MSDLAGTFRGLPDCIEHWVKTLDERHQICVVSRVDDPLTVLIPVKQCLIVVEGTALGSEAPRADDDRFGHLSYLLGNHSLSHKRRISAVTCEP